MTFFQWIYAFLHSRRIFNFYHKRLNCGGNARFVELENFPNECPFSVRSLLPPRELVEGSGQRVVGRGSRGRSGGWFDHAMATNESQGY